ncbi:tubulin folding cofactor D [Cavenderia fasciculata]|uniref:Tubulin folding cofactor D n=1 Tax=Cavenderia fasciculata TaxID=261658 RepID=F4PT56_CACFS|nr:tubulin folding cofactor D [Cavenderia fasciculata]EGG21632.1 tubulin folding cofactor D [Cavenderia fasciculata]|eukprot:XP_004359482.1 tubulin folding cofactor D [Cavenderia fasciculata]
MTDQRGFYEGSEENRSTAINYSNQIPIAGYESLTELADTEQCQHRAFVFEAQELMALVQRVSTYQSATTKDDNIEFMATRITFILEQYQEQSNLLDKYLGDIVSMIITPLLNHVHDSFNKKKLSTTQKVDDHWIGLCYKILYTCTKVRGAKTIVKLFPHQVQDLLPVTLLLENRLKDFYSQEKETIVDDESSKTTYRIQWEEIYIISLWLSLLIIIPFKFSSVDGKNPEDDQDSLSNRIIRLCKMALGHSSKIRDSVAELLSKLLTRPDMNNQLVQYLQWCTSTIDGIRSQVATSEQNLYNIGISTTLSLLFKRADRKLLQLDDHLYQQIIQSIKDSSIERVNQKLYTKLLQRMALFILPQTNNASWRYQRVIKRLLQNNQHSLSSDQQEGEHQLPPESSAKIEEIIEILMSDGLGNKDTTVRWTSAKAMGRIIGLLDQEMGEQVIGFIFTCFEGEPDPFAWHGGCLALAELCRRGLILPDNIGNLVEKVNKALFLDVLKGSYSVGSYVRDAACYVAWALARTYQPSVLEPFSSQLASNLLVVSMFDREINCRKSASAAFQELVGRLGGMTIPHGIDIVQIVDYQAVGNRKHSYLEIAPIIAKFAPYYEAIVNHLVTSKIGHWDIEIRQLTSKALKELTTINPSFCISHLPFIIQQTKSDELNIKHGYILSLSQILFGVSKLLNNNNLKSDILMILSDRKYEKIFKGKGGMYIRLSLCKLIYVICILNLELETHNSSTSQSSTASLSLKEKILLLKSKKTGSSTVPQPLSATPSSSSNSYLTVLTFLEENIQHPLEEIQKEAAISTRIFLTNYMSTLEKEQQLGLLVKKYCDLLKNDLNRSTRRGASLFIGNLPEQYYLDHEILDIVIYPLYDEKLKDIETRVNSLNSLKRLFTIYYDRSRMTLQLFDKIFRSLMDATEDYCVDRRGDIGSWSRELSCQILNDLVLLDLKNGGGQSPNITKSSFSQYFCKLLQLAGEKLDKIRETCCLLIVQLVNNQQLESYIDNASELKDIFNAIPPKPTIMNWSRSDMAFPRLCKVLNYGSYRYPLLLGLFSSIGGSSRSLAEDVITNIQEIDRNLLLGTSFELLGNSIDRTKIPNFKSVSFLFNSQLFDQIQNNETNEKIFFKVKESIIDCNDIILLFSVVPLISYFTKDIFNSKIKTESIGLLLGLLSNKFPRVRKFASQEMIYRFGSNKLATDLLSKTEWDQEINLETLDLLYKHFGIENKKVGIVVSKKQDTKSIDQSNSSPVVLNIDNQLPEDSEDLMEI